MSLPRCIRPGCYWLVTRRTLNRMFLLMPRAWVKRLFAYAVAWACEVSGVSVIGGSVMSSHYHLVVYDARGTLPRFAQALDELVARAANAEWERRDYFWESTGVKYTALLTTEAIEEAVVYCLTNPQEAGLVARSAAWQHWQTQPAVFGTESEVGRPELRFFTARTVLPDSVRFVVAVPPTHAARGVAGWREVIARRLAKREAELDIERAGRPYLGMERVLAFKPTDAAPLDEVVGELEPKSKVGRLEGASAAHRAYRAMLAEFRSKHRAAYLAMRAGEDPVFPFGTYAWCVVAGRRCERAPMMG